MTTRIRHHCIRTSDPLRYLGALRRLAERAQGPGFFLVADLHAMTTRHDPSRLANLTRETALLLLAAGMSQESVLIRSASSSAWFSTRRGDGASR
jgi:tryptophanyl-tRNA synthetase